MWLQNRTPARAINGKTPYEMRHKTKPSFARIQEFGAAAYVKDLKAGKLDARAKVGCFVSYDSESKGYKIYWPGKRSITVEKNIVFNQDDVHTSKETAIIYGETQSEGEINKTIQAPQNNVNEVKKPENEEPNDQWAQKPVSEPHPSYQPSNSVTFPTKDNFQDESDSETPENDQYGHRKRNRPPPGAFKAMNEGTTAITILEDLDNNIDNNKHLDCLHGIPSDIALVGHISSDPRTLDEALQGPNAED